MSYYLRTAGKNNNTYAITDTDDPNVKMLTGGNYNNNQIYVPESQKIQPGKPFSFSFTNNALNGDLRGKRCVTSPVTDINVIPPTKTTYGFQFNTSSANNSSYAVINSDDPKYQILTGGKFSGCEIYAIDNVESGKPFECKFTNNPANGNFAGKSLKTSAIKDLEPIKLDAYAKDACIVEVITPNAADDCKSLREHYDDMFMEIAEKLGLSDEHDDQQNVFVSDFKPYVPEQNGMKRWFEEKNKQQQIQNSSSEQPDNMSKIKSTIKVAFQNIGKLTNKVKDIVKDVVQSHVSKEATVSEPQQINQFDLKSMQQYTDKKLGLDTQSRLQHAILTEQMKGRKIKGLILTNDEGNLDFVGMNSSGLLTSRSDMKNASISDLVFEQNGADISVPASRYAKDDSGMSL